MLNGERAQRQRERPRSRDRAERQRQRPRQRQRERERPRSRIELDGHVNGNGNGNGPALNGHKRSLRYTEGPRIGFGIEIEQVGERIEVLGVAAARALAHVLYTNVVEPILRWLFASKGYALVHGACFARRRATR